MANSKGEITSNDLKLEIVVIPVSDVDRAKEFYTRIGWRRASTPTSLVVTTSA
jgi:predicted lactoylglutathione lyase